MKPKYWDQAKKELSKDDPILSAIIQRYSGEVLQSRGNPFETLFRSIVGQQISVMAAQSVWNKVVLCLPAVDPVSVRKAKMSSLRSAGLSERKVLYAKDLARHFEDQLLRPTDWTALDDEQIIQDLIQVKGIGRWTAEMFLIFHLLRPDVFPADDLGLQKAISIEYKKRYPLSDRNLKSFRNQFSPWSSVATWYLWRSLDPIPVAY